MSVTGSEARTVDRDESANARVLWALSVLVEQRLDALVSDRLSSIQTLGVSGHEDLDAVASAFGDLGGIYSGIQPGRQGRVAEVVRAGRER